MKKKNNPRFGRIDEYGSLSQRGTKEWLDKYPKDRIPDKIKGFRKEFFISIVLSVALTIYLVFGGFLNYTGIKAIVIYFLIFGVSFLVFWGILMFVVETSRILKRKSRTK